MTISSRGKSYVLGATGHEHERLIRQDARRDQHAADRRLPDGSPLEPKKRGKSV